MPKPKKKPAPKPKPLTDKQKRFAQEYLIDMNATQAAIRAGYSKKTANPQGARLLANVSVSEYIKQGQELLANRSKKGADWVVERLEHEAENAGSDSARVAALDKLGKHYGIFEIDNSQKGAARSEELERLLAIAAGAG